MGKYQKCQPYNQQSTFWGRSWKRDGKWWLQDPQGNLSFGWFHGVDQIQFEFVKENLILILCNWHADFRPTTLKMLPQLLIIDLTT